MMKGIRHGAFNFQTGGMKYTNLLNFKKDNHGK